jgi:hypothetical protein
LNWYPLGSIFHTPYRTGDCLDPIDFTVGAVSERVLEREYRCLVKAGGKATPYAPRTTGGWMARVQDPDGVWITIGPRPTRAERGRSPKS